MSKTQAVPFEGTPPQVQPGDPIEIRDAFGTWYPNVAQSEPRYDYATAIGGQCHLTVAVGRLGTFVNWPAEHVRAVFRSAATRAEGTGGN